MHNAPLPTPQIRCSLKVLPHQLRRVSVVCGGLSDGRLEERLDNSGERCGIVWLSRNKVLDEVGDAGWVEVEESIAEGALGDVPNVGGRP
jgi:hypothetical protein